MFARVRTTNGVPEKVDDGIKHFREVVASGYKDVAGFKGAYLLVNRKSGKLMGRAVLHLASHGLGRVRRASIHD